MFLTLYFMAASLVQSWRLNSLATKIRQLQNLNGSLVLYKEPDVMNFAEDGCLISNLGGISSNCCLNKYQARVGDLLWYVGSKYSCSIFPKQIVDITEWISFHGMKSQYPVDTKLSNVLLNSSQKISVIVEASYLQTCDSQDTKLCQLWQYGNPQAWKAGDFFSIILETDVVHLAKLGVNFMLHKLSVEDMELIRIESVEVEGRPHISLGTVSVPLYYPVNCIDESNLDDSDAVLNSNFVNEYRFNENWNAHSFSEDAKTVKSNEFGADKNVRQSVPAHSEEYWEYRIDCEENGKNHEASSSTHYCKESQSQKATDDIERILESNVMKSVCLKPPNILIFSESAVAHSNLKQVLNSILNKNRYTIYTVHKEQLIEQPWMENTCLLVVSGNVPQEAGSCMLSYFLGGGKILCLCSDLLHLVLPTFQTAEVRENELVSFSYGQWQHVHLMHHIFCYQASPSHVRFKHYDDNRMNPLKPPSSVEVLDINKTPQKLQIEVLGVDDTWQTPSLVMATAVKTSGRVIFSQVHLEINPQQYETDDSMFAALKESDTARLDILRDLLITHLNLQCDSPEPIPDYTPGYLLGNKEVKEKFLQEFLQQSENLLKLPEYTITFIGKNCDIPKATEVNMPVFTDITPASFAATEYFKNLKSKTLGQIILYSEVVTSSMKPVSGAILSHGLAVVVRQQTQGIGRSGNTWISPDGCAMFTLHLHIPSTSYLGQHLLLLQHLSGLAIVLAVSSMCGYEKLKLKLKWPNDIYIGRTTKIGGIVINSFAGKSSTICNIGCGVNLSNRLPTVSINTLIKEYNKTTSDYLAELTLEKYLAAVFTKFEELFEKLQSGSVAEFLELYYAHWLHSDADITVMDTDGAIQTVTVVGIDDYGFLFVRDKYGNCFSVHPDGNSFDMSRGLVKPKQTYRFP